MKIPMKPVLIVDDDAAVRYLLGRALQAWGFVVMDVSDVAHARPLIEQCAIVLLDLNMPGMDGDRYLEELRESGDGTPVIVFTGSHPKPVMIERLSRFDALEILEKPMTTADYQLVIDVIVRMVGNIYNLESCSDKLADYIAKRR